MRQARPLTLLKFSDGPVRDGRTHRHHAELHLFIQLQLLLLQHLTHVKVELRVLCALDEPRLVGELDHDALEE